MSSLEQQSLDTVTKQRVHKWLKGSFDPQTKQTIQEMLINDPKGILDAFYTNLSFGTGGLRGIMGVGTNRMNEYTVQWATQGLANYIKKYADPKKGVAIGYDSRKNSAFFALEAACVLAGNEIPVYLFKELRPTPLVSFACRYKDCQAAIMITASHNPPEYNGYKVYWDDGAQVLPPHDVGIIEEVNKIDDPKNVLRAKKESPLIQYLDESVDNAYLAIIQQLQIEKNKKSTIRVLYSSLHGTGSTMVPKALQLYGHKDVSFVQEQIIPDGTFPTTNRPNPEEKEALHLGIEQMLRERQDIFIATDPDADRIGVVVRHNNEAVCLTGNQVAGLLASYICEAKDRMGMPQKPALVKTFVTTDLVDAVSKKYNCALFSVPPGFKYIAEKIRIWENEKEGYTYLFGGEESYGYLFGTHVRDKDAVIISALIADLAAEAKRNGKTLVNLLDELYMEHGVFIEKVVSIQFQDTKEGKEAMLKSMQVLRDSPPREIASKKVIAITDYQLGYKENFLTKEKNTLNSPSVNALIFEIEGGSRVIVRPSGTESKVKVYLMVRLNVKDTLRATKEQAELLLISYEQSVKKLFL